MKAPGRGSADRAVAVSRQRGGRDRLGAPCMANTIDLAGRIAAVTGGAKGIGRAIAERFLASGAAVAIWDQDGALAVETAAALKAHGPVLPIGVDVTALS